MSSHPSPMPTRQAKCIQRGASLIEVLVSVLVLTFGILGAAALQSRALRNNQSSYEHAQMTVLAQSILDAMRANRAGMSAGAYEMASWTCSAPSGAGLAANDLTLWIGNLHQQIHPGACGRITCAARDCLVGIRWDDSRGTGGSSTQQFELRSRL